MITTILFDLDGTLLPMDQDIFVSAYMKGLAAAAAPHGYDPRKLVQAVLTGTAAMVGNNGCAVNEEVFWAVLAGIFGEKILQDRGIFDEFYRTDFQKVREACGCSPKAAQLLQAVKKLGFRTVLATNPLFPRIATESRIRWAGLSPEDFELFTTYETSRFCKPDLRYYEETCRRVGVSPEECLMVGNDVGEDMIAGQLGMKVFLLTDCLINKEEKDISAYPHGSFDDLLTHLEGLSGPSL